MRPETLHRPSIARELARPWTALLLAAVLVLGGAVHFGHHLLDPGCDDGHGPNSHPCVACASLHGAALAVAAVSAAPPASDVVSDVVAPAPRAPRAAARTCGSPRAPPLV